MTTISSASSAAATGTAAAAASGRTAAATLAKGFDGFLKLLTTQLQNQDPLSPMDATQFTSQLVQFSTVEQAIQTNTQLKQLSGLLQGNALTSAVGFVGTRVEFDGGGVRLGETGGATADYTLPAAASAATVTVRNAGGTIVRQEQVDGATAGAHRYAWDGLDAQGRRAAAGLYRIDVSAVDASGKALTVGRSTSGTVEAVESGPSGISLVVGGAPVALGDVTNVSRPASGPA